LRQGIVDLETRDADRGQRGDDERGQRDDARPAQRNKAKPLDAERETRQDAVRRGRREIVRTVCLVGRMQATTPFSTHTGATPGGARAGSVAR
jgi:hypothetical protein